MGQNFLNFTLCILNQSYLGKRVDTNIFSNVKNL